MEVHRTRMLRLCKACSLSSWTSQSNFGTSSRARALNSSAFELQRTGRRAPQVTALGVSLPKLTHRSYSSWQYKAHRCYPTASVSESNASRSTFTYPPLRSPDQTARGPTFRLLTLLPGSSKDNLNCRLEVVALSKAFQYEAISYCWGDPSDTETIMCNDTAIAVPWNLAAALRGLRLLDRPRVLWADAVCINQSSASEKDSQVRLMQAIFARAQRTLIWLGAATDKHDEGMSRVAAFGVKAGLVGIRWATRAHFMPAIRVRDMGGSGNAIQTLEPFSAEFYISLVRFLRRPWFRRAWIVQEVVVSKRATFIWDLREYEWDDVVQALKAMANARFPLAFLPSLQHMASIENERQRYRSGDLELLGLLMRQQRCLSTDPRDKVFSFCGLLGPSHELVKVNYMDNVEDVFRNLAIQLLRNTQSLDILSRPPLPTCSVRQLPSWVPDWGMCSSTGRAHTFGIGPRSLAGTEDHSGKEFVPRFSTSGRSSFTFTISMAPNELVVQGYIYDKVKKVGPVFEGTELPNAINTVFTITRGWSRTHRTFLECRAVIMSWRRMVDEQSNTLLLGGKPLDEVFWQTICAGELFESAKVASAARFWKRVTTLSGFFATHVPGWLEGIGVSFCASVLLWQILFRRPLLEYELQGRYTLNRRMVITENGLIALAGCVVREGDQLAICKGSSVPLLLRQANSSREWTLVGDAYVHGIMNGEHFDKGRCTSLTIV
jgi:hypothetical protein